MSYMIDFWLEAYALPPDRFAAISNDVLAIMADGLTPEETKELKRLLRERRSRLPFLAN